MLKVTCPTCTKRGELASLTEWPQFPFCSPRCKLIDLGRWLGEEYRLPESDTSADPESDDPAT
ncbi:MAG: DNA gyrase inhibitor YacG [Gemmatales bacterium]